MYVSKGFVVSLCFTALGCVGDSTVVPDASTDAAKDVSTSDAADASADVSVDVSVDAPKEAGPPFPATLSGVVVWLDAQDTSTLQITGGKVTTWTDRTNFQHDAVAVSGHEPTTGTDSAHGLPIVKFASADMKLAGAASDPSLQLGDTGDFLVEMVMLNTTSGAVILHGMSTTAPTAGLNIAVISGEDRVSFGVSYSGPLAHDTVSSLDGKLRLFGLQRTANGTTLTVRDNGTANGTQTIAATNLTNGATFHLGAFDATTSSNVQQFMTGAIGEVVIVKGTVSDPDRTALESYMMTKWQLP